MSIRNPEIPVRPEVETRKNYLAVDKEGICLSIICVGEHTDMSWTRDVVEEEGGQLRVFKDELFHVGLREGIEINGTRIEEIEDYLEPLNDGIDKD